MMLMHKAYENLRITLLRMGTSGRSTGRWHTFIAFYVGFTGGHPQENRPENGQNQGQTT